MKVSHIEHIGIAVNSINEALGYFTNVLGLECYKIEEVADQKVRTAFILVGETKIELLEPIGKESTIAKFLEKHGQGIHHIAFAVSDGLENALSECQTQSINVIDVVPRLGADEMNVAFLHPKSTNGVLTELCEKER